MRSFLPLVSAVAALAGPAAAQAQTFVPAPNRVDVVQEHGRGQMTYISTSDGRILRYQASTGTHFPTFNLGGNLGGIDLSPDESTLVVADRTSSQPDAGVFLVNLETGNATRHAVPKAFGEAAMFTAVYGADGNVYTTSDYAGSGWIPLRKLDPATGQWTTLASVRMRTMLSPSGDGQTIAFAEASSSDGPWGLIDLPTGQIVRRSGYTNGTSWFNFEIATDQFGSQFSIPTYNGAYVYGDTYQKITTLGTYAGQLPIGVAYHPVRQLAFFPWNQTAEVRAYDMSTLTQTASWNVGSTFGWVGNHAFEQGRTRIARDGSALMVTVAGGVSLIAQYAPVAAVDTLAQTVQEQSVDIPLAGSVGNGDPVTFELATPPLHGTVTVAGNVAHYTPTPGYYGSDAFAYNARYGRAVDRADVAIQITPLNRAPVAVNDAAKANKNAVLIPVLANDSDPDGDALTITAVTQPAKKATTQIQGNQIRFTPAPGFSGPVTFSYTISDGHGHTATAVVTVTKG